MTRKSIKTTALKVATTISFIGLFFVHDNNLVELLWFSTCCLVFVKSARALDKLIPTKDEII